MGVTTDNSDRIRWNNTK